MKISKLDRKIYSNLRMDDNSYFHLFFDKSNSKFYNLKSIKCISNIFKDLNMPVHIIVQVLKLSGF